MERASTAISPAGVVHKRARMKDTTLAYLIIAPAVILIAAFSLVPVAWSIYLSFTKGGTLSPPVFVGVSNFIQIWQDPLFITTLKNTFQFAITIIPLAIFLGLFLASLLNRLKWLKGLFIGFIFFPMIPATVISSLAWQYVIYPYGPINYVLNHLGLPSINWLMTPRAAFWTIVIFELWKGIGFYVVVFFSALRNIPTSLYEAARIDGCPEYKLGRYITLPMLKPTLAFTTVMATIWNFQIFDSVYILTQGGPLFQTSTISWYIYKRAFTDDMVGSASTVSVVLLVIIMIFTLIQLRVFKNDVEYS